MFSSVAELVSVVKKLTLPDVQGFGVGEGSMAGNGDIGSDGEREYA